MGIHRQGRKDVDVFQNRTARIYMIHRQVARFPSIMQGILIFALQFPQIVQLGTFPHSRN